MLQILCVNFVIQDKKVYWQKFKITPRYIGCYFVCLFFLLMEWLDILNTLIYMLNDSTTGVTVLDHRVCKAAG